jgi:hypothetical protein
MLSTGSPLGMAFEQGVNGRMVGRKERRNKEKIKKPAASPPTSTDFMTHYHKRVAEFSLACSYSFYFVS